MLRGESEFLPVCVVWCGVRLGTWFCRQRALKALDERLKKSSEPAASWPSLDEAGSSSQDEVATSPTPAAGTELEAVVVEKDPSKVKTDSTPKPPPTHEQTAAKTETV